MAPHRILYVDPDEAAREETIAELRAALSDLDPVVEGAGSLDAAEAVLDRDLTVLITEYDLPGGTGFELINATQEAWPDAGCILYTDTDPETLDTDLLRGSITEYVGKGSVFGTERLARLVRTTAERGGHRSYPHPQNESERVAALKSYDLADTALLSSLDRLSTLAADHFSVERASINIINEHSQEFIACYGDTDEWETMDRQDSICTFTILEDELMTVEDVTEDSRFESRSEALLDLGIRSYMGANIVTNSGLVVGPLCIYDDKVRSFSADDEQYITELAAVASDFLELHARLDGGATTTGGDR